MVLLWYRRALDKPISIKIRSLPGTPPTPPTSARAFPCAWETVSLDRATSVAAVGSPRAKRARSGVDHPHRKLDAMSKLWATSEGANLRCRIYMPQGPSLSTHLRSWPPCQAAPAGPRAFVRRRRKGAEWAETTSGTGRLAGQPATTKARVPRPIPEPVLPGAYTIPLCGDSVRMGTGRGRVRARILRLTP